ncbi:MAG: hypothetical protein H7259_07255, partial [Cytophagales bacterium]|nr:hypothetical protein [Cytophaga sp.]
MNILHVLPSQYAGGSELCAFETIKGLNTEGVTNFAVFPYDGTFVQDVSLHVQDYSIIPNFWWISNPKWPLLLRLNMLKSYLIAA